jgi:Protein of unknown function (DUF664)
MTWVAPEVTVVYGPFVADERTMLEGWLDRQRAMLLWICAGLTAEQLATRSVPPSRLSLLGLVRHHVDVERIWFRDRVAGEQVSREYWRQDQPDAAFDEAGPEHAERDYARLTREWELCRAAAAGRSLDDTFTAERWGELSLRWVYCHVIAEYTQHNGHADLLRERIDGRTSSNGN